MEERDGDTLGVYYQPSNLEVWKGRETDANLAPQYWYQSVRSFAELTIQDKYPAPLRQNFGLLGYACEEGVRRNQGRVGAAAGPLAIRQQLAKLAWHSEGIGLWDAGDVVCENQDLEQAQKLLSQQVTSLLELNVFPIVLGGGHDIAYGHAKGLLANLKPQQRLGIINFDAHFDLRPPVNGPNSGTPFYQLLTYQNPAIAAIDYLAIGIQEAANTPQLFSIAQSLSVDFVLLENCQWHHLARILNRLSTFLEKVDAIYVTIDLDGFSAAYAPGVSAAAPIGLEPTFVFELLKSIVASKKLISFDVAELNPRFDLDHRTAKLAARLIDFLLRQLKGTKS